MANQFDPQRFELMDEDRIHLADQPFGHDDRAELDVWTASSDGGTAFVRQVTVRGAVAPERQGVNALACYFLRERATGRVFFLEHDARGYYLQNASFWGAETYFGVPAEELGTWLEARLAGVSSTASHGIDPPSGPDRTDLPAEAITADA